MMCIFIIVSTICTSLCYGEGVCNETALQEAEARNSTGPCVKYTCSGGNMTVEECPKHDDPLCTIQPGNGPFPACCNGPVFCS
uniref:Putative secreted protein n=1 Tax=Amblyomma triste TaxID=251400 RepID=A0A023G970_AMBTT